MQVCCFCFFFSSRRRHTRFDCDWSSDVCSSDLGLRGMQMKAGACDIMLGQDDFAKGDRKSTRLNSSHSQISYAVFCLKKKKILSSIVRVIVSNLGTLLGMACVERLRVITLISLH